jgi:HSP20 family protein
MFGTTRWTQYDDVFNFQREVDRLFNRFWTDLPTRTAVSASPSFQVHTTNDGWQVDVPLPGIDPKHVNLEVAGNTLSIRVDVPADSQRQAFRHEQTLSIPPFLDLEKLNASHQHGMLRLTLPIKDAVKPRRVQIQVPEDQRQLAGVS